MYEVQLNVALALMSAGLACILGLSLGLVLLCAGITLAFCALIDRIF